VTPKQFEPVLRALHELPRAEDRRRLIQSLTLMDDGPFHYGLKEFVEV